MACGTPILGSNNAMMRELVIPGKTGALYQGTEIGLGQAMNELLKNRNQLESWGDQARHKINNQYRLSGTIKQIEELLNTLNSVF